MDNKEAICRIEDHIRVHRIGEYPHILLAEALKKAMEALRAQPENKPLTLDELREMDGPVWVCYPQETFGPQYPSEDSLRCTKYKFGFDNYGKTWLAYRHKPEEVRNEL